MTRDRNPVPAVVLFVAGTLLLVFSALATLKDDIDPMVSRPGLVIGPLLMLVGGGALVRSARKRD